jgi:hypothetical protein
MRRLSLFVLVCGLVGVTLIANGDWSTWERLDATKLCARMVGDPTKGGGGGGGDPPPPPPEYNDYCCKRGKHKTCSLVIRDDKTLCSEA